MMDELIYILVLVAWVAYSIFNAKQKKKQKEQQAKSAPKPQPQYETAEPQKPKRSVLEDLFGEEFFEELQVEEEVSYKKEVPVKEPALTSYQPQAPEKPDEEVYKSASQLIREMKDEEMESITVDGDENPVKGFDLRKAVIYSTILERPYH
jgi:hypothetical protein